MTDKHLEAMRREDEERTEAIREGIEVGDCPRCEGRGWVSHNHVPDGLSITLQFILDCPRCEGTGHVTDPQRTPQQGQA
jgi:DnaJ-class molecular chaperone